MNASTSHRVIDIDMRGDTVLADGVRRGDESAFETIMRRHNRLLFRSARGVLDDDAEAQDVVQETYLRAFASMQSFRADAALGTWLVRIAINIALDARRRKGRAVQLDDTQDLSAEPAREHLTVFHALADEGPDSAAERSQVRASLAHAIDRLPVIYRSVFILRAVEEMSVDEVAFSLQVSNAVVKTRYLRARSMLRDALGAPFEAHALHVFAFAGARCDAVVAQVLAALKLAPSMWRAFRSRQ